MKNFWTHCGRTICAMLILGVMQSTPVVTQSKAVEVVPLDRAFDYNCNGFILHIEESGTVRYVRTRNGVTHEHWNTTTTATNLTTGKSIHGVARGPIVTTVNSDGSVRIFSPGVVNGIAQGQGVVYLTAGLTIITIPADPAIEPVVIEKGPRSNFDSLCEFMRTY